MRPSLARAPSNFMGARTGMSAGNRTGSVPPGPGTSLRREGLHATAVSILHWGYTLLRPWWPGTRTAL